MSDGRRDRENDMHKAIILAAGLALVGTSAFGQSSWRDRDDDRRGWRDDRRDSRDRDEMRGRSMRDDDDGRGHGRAARFFLRSGDTRVAVRCDDQESMRACVDATLTLFDRIRAQGTTSTAPASPGPSSPAPSSPAR